MSRTAVRRLVESFFRRWPLYLAFVVVALIFGFLRIQQSAAEYVSTGSILADDQTLVTAQSGVQPNAYYGYLSPAQFTSQELYGLIVTDVFMESVVATAEIELSPIPKVRALELQGFRLALQVFPTNGNIIQINATTPDPEQSARLARAVIDEFIDFKIGIDLAESGASEEFFSELVEPYRKELDDARAAVDEALQAIEGEETVTAGQNLRIDRLRAAEAQAQERYQEALNDVELAQLAQLQTETNIQQGYAVLDSPSVPTEPVGRLLDDVMVMAMFGLVGLILAMAAPVGSALTNKTLVFADDLDPAQRVQVIATIPKIRKRSLNLDGATVEPVEIEDGLVWISPSASAVPIHEDASKTAAESAPAFAASESEDAVAVPDGGPDVSADDVPDTAAEPVAETAAEVPAVGETETDVPAVGETETDVPAVGETQTDVPAVAEIVTDVPAVAEIVTDVPAVAETETDAPSEGVSDTSSVDAGDTNGAAPAAKRQDSKKRSSVVVANATIPADVDEGSEEEPQAQVGAALLEVVIWDLDTLDDDQDGPMPAEAAGEGNNNGLDGSNGHDEAES